MRNSINTVNNSSNHIKSNALTSKAEEYLNNYDPYDMKYFELNGDILSYRSVRLNN